MTAARKTMVQLPDGTTLPRLGLGTWRMGESAARRKDEIRAVRHAIQSGFSLIDTAEMYGDGGAEDVVGAAVRTSGIARDRLFVVSKVYPWNASRHGTIAARRFTLGPWTTVSNPAPKRPAPRSFCGTNLGSVRCASSGC